MRGRYIFFRQAFFRLVLLLMTAGPTVGFFYACSPSKMVVAHREYVTSSGLTYVLTRSGKGATIGPNDMVVMHYTASLDDGTKFDSSLEREDPVRIRMGTDKLIPGLREGLLLLREGDHARLYIPAKLAYGQEGYGPVPPDTKLVYQLQIIGVLKAPEDVAPNEMPKQKTASGIEYIVIEAGEGPGLERGMRVVFHYTGYLEDFSVFDSSYERGEPVTITLGQGMVVPGLEQGLLQLSKGDKARLWIPYHMAYGERGRDPIPAKTNLVFDVHVTEAERTEKPVMKPVREKDVITTASGLKIIIVEEGRGVRPEKDQVITVHYSGFLSDGSLFDSSVQRGEPLKFVMGAKQIIPGLEEGISQLRTGTHARLIIPPELAYGEEGKGSVPPGEVLIFDVKLLSILP
jgi:peptidylprolyl isomerase